MFIATVTFPSLILSKTILTIYSTNWPCYRLQLSSSYLDVLRGANVLILLLSVLISTALRDKIQVYL